MTDSSSLSSSKGATTTTSTTDADAATAGEQEVPAAGGRPGDVLPDEVGNDGKNNVVVAASVVFVEVDVIIPVHNSSSTVREAVLSAMRQRRRRRRPASARERRDEDDELPPSFQIVVHVCCYDDGSTDDSWKALQDLVKEVQRSHSASMDSAPATNNGTSPDPSTFQDEDGGGNRSDDTFWEAHLHISQSADGVSRGAGYARNRAVDLRPPINTNDDHHHPPHHHQFLCLLDSDDVMSDVRMVTQVRHMLSLSPAERDRCLLGCNFVRDPEDSTAHYTAWANGLTNERLHLERFREVTILQPTWMMTRSRFDELGGYVEAPRPSSGPDLTIQSFLESLGDAGATKESQPTHRGGPPLVHPEETLTTLRLAEDLRFFHSHLASNGVLMKCQGPEPLVVYRHHANATSQSSSTPRRLLLQLRALAFERSVLERDPVWKGKFVVWGAGRDGKDFCKALSSRARLRVCCMADVDDAKIASGSYVNPQLGVTIPIVHFSYLVRDDGVRDKLTSAWREGRNETHFGRIDKSRASNASVAGPPVDPKRSNPRKRKLNCEQELDISQLPHLPVVVCVAMYRTGGALESNVQLIGRTEGNDLWHFS